MTSQTTTLIDAQAGTVNITSSKYSLDDATGFAVQWNITGTAIAGTAKVQASIDGVNFKDLDSQAVSTAGSYFANLVDQNYKVIQLHWAFGTSTNATVTAYINVKK